MRLVSPICVFSFVFEDICMAESPYNDLVKTMKVMKNFQAVC